MMTNYENPNCVISGLCRRDLLVVMHDLLNIRVNLRMKDEAHQPRRSAIR